MKKNTITAVFSAAVLLMTMCGCTAQNADPTAHSEPVQTATIPLDKEKTNYFNGYIKSNDFSYFADPNLWAYVNSSDDTCEIRMITGKDINQCGFLVGSGQAIRIKLEKFVQRHGNFLKNTSSGSEKTAPNEA